MTFAIGLYVMAFIIAALGWLCLAFNWPAGLRIAGRTAFALTAFTLVIHTLALVARMYISGRPPVTNLYSSAVFIGWGCVVLGLILEVVFRRGLGNVVAAVAGYSTLLIAWGLESDGSDTFSVMQAVLDTQFWLATHVTCITLGYATTYLAGLFGLLYIVLGLMSPWLTPQLAKDLNRMNYGTLCFSIFFSFVGTVLGGLWADDSWGRFWGWDPKENGALMIVLWNALALHARWGGMVKERGLAVLSVIGNIVVSWSWFGVNALSVGLHAYGFDQRIFTLFCALTAAHLGIMALGLVPQRLWRSR
jgi:ABC-type transport system involved in cytochrome c biogenesis permease subunit